MPRRAATVRLGKTRKRAVGHVAGLHLHPYTVAVKLGRGIRFTVPLETLENELTNTITPQIETP